jgi:hypothetical protein
MADLFTVTTEELISELLGRQKEIIILHDDQKDETQIKIHSSLPANVGAFNLLRATEMLSISQMQLTEDWLVEYVKSQTGEDDVQPE